MSKLFESIEKVLKGLRLNFWIETNLKGLSKIWNGLSKNFAKVLSKVGKSKILESRVNFFNGLR